MHVIIGLLLATLALTSVCADQTFRITGNDGTTAFIFNFNGTEVKTPTLNVTVGETLTFRIEAIMVEGSYNVSFGLSDAFNANPRDFSAPSLGGLKTSSGCVANPESDFQYSWTTVNVSNPCIITWTVVQPDQAQDNKFFYTSRIKAMWGTINVTSTATPSPTGTTTSPPTGTGGATTPVPTTTAPPTSSTGKNSAAIILPGAAALIIAAINTLFA